MQRRRLGTGSVAAIVIATIVLACVTSTAAIRALHASRQEPFAAACRAARTGAPYADAQAAFGRIGEPVRGHSYRADDLATPQTSAFFRRTGLSRWQQCTIELDPATQRIVWVDLEAGTDFTHCTDRRVYPRRFWLCAVGDWLAL